MSSAAAIRQALSAIEQKRARMEILSLRGVCNVARSYDGGRIAALGRGLVQIWRSAPLAWERSFFLPSLETNTGLAFSRDGSWLAVSGPRTIWRCDLETGSVAAFCEGSGAGTDALGFAEDGRLVLLDEQGDLRAWGPSGDAVPADYLSAEPLPKWGKPPGVLRLRGHSNAAGEIDPYDGIARGSPPLCFIPDIREGHVDGPFLTEDGRLAVVSMFEWSGQNSTHEYLVWDLRWEHPPRLLDTERSEETPIYAISPDKTLVATPYEWASSVAVWSLRTGEILTRIAHPYEREEDDDWGEHPTVLDLNFLSDDSLRVHWSSPVDDEPDQRLDYRLSGGEPILYESGNRKTPYPWLLQSASGRRATIRQGDGEPPWTTSLPLGSVILGLGPDGTLAIAEKGGLVKLRTKGQRQRRFWTCIPDPQGVEWTSDGQALMIRGRWAIAWYQRDGVFLGRVLLPSIEDVHFAPGEQLLIALEGGTLVRWTFGA